MAYTRTMNGKVPQVLQELHFDETPTLGSLNPVTSGGVAGSVAQQSSNLAPNYTKTTYPANSYVMQGGVLYTNPNAIGTAEDWNPAHWTQTTVAEMMAGAGGGGESSYTSRAIDVYLDEEDVTVQVNQKDVLTVRVNDSYGYGLIFDISNVTDAYVIVSCSAHDTLDQGDISFKKNSVDIPYAMSLTYSEYSDVNATLVALDSSKSECNSTNDIVYRIVGDTVLCNCAYHF